MVLAVNRTYGRPDQFDVDVVRAHLDLHPHSHDAVSVHLEALVPQLVRRAFYRRIVRHRGDEISPCPQFHTPTGTETTETPQTRSTGSQPALCRSKASSMERPEVTPRAREGGGATANDLAPLSISALASIAGAAPGLTRSLSCSVSRTVGRGEAHVEVLEAPHAVAPQGAVDDLVTLRKLAIGDLDPGAVQGIAHQLLAHLLAGQLPHGHVRLADLLDFVGRRRVHPNSRLPSIRYSVMQ